MILGNFVILIILLHENLAYKGLLLSKRGFQYLGLYGFEWEGKFVEDNLEMTRSETLKSAIHFQLK